MGAIDEAVRSFEQDGYYVARSLFSNDEVAALVELIDRSLSPALAPVEFEADVHYPGAPSSKTAPGGNTPRRLLHAFGRDSLFRQVGRHPQVIAMLKALMNTGELCLSQNHHNCVMTKHPGFSSVTSWHQDIRYWRFDRRELVSTWLALGPENRKNGGLLVIPGSHTLDFEPGQFDASLFLRTDLEANEALLAKAVAVELNAGDMLFFHSRTLHAAGQNDFSGDQALAGVHLSGSGQLSHSGNPLSRVRRHSGVVSVSTEPAQSPINGLTYAPEWAGTNLYLACQPVRDCASRLHVEELPVIAKAAKLRRRTFASGRVSARAALAVAGLPGVALPKAPDGAVVWPEGVIGSISHTNTWAVAAVAVTDMSEAISLGIDLERIQTIETDVLELVSLPDERKELSEAGSESWQATALFSFKESIYKCLRPSWGRFIGFDEVAISGIASGRAQLRFCNEALAHHFDRAASEVQLRMAISPAHVFTLAWLRQVE